MSRCLFVKFDLNVVCRDCFEKELDANAKDDVVAKKLWDYSMKACGLTEQQQLKDEASDNEASEGSDSASATES